MMETGTDNFQPMLTAHAAGLLKTHESLLRDAVRNRAFHEALSLNVREGSNVLDIGSGSGVWAVAAAKLGAGRVVAVERDELMIGVINMLAAEHGVSDRVEAVCGNSFELPLGKEFDLVVSETIGYIGYEENIAAIIHDARTRFLKEGGRLIPETVCLYAAAGKMRTRLDPLPSGLPFHFRQMERLSLSAPFVLRSSTDVDILTAPACLIETDLRDASATPDLTNLSAGWDLRAAEIDCMVMWVESRLTDGVNLSTRDTTSWRPNVYRIDPVDGDACRVDLRLSLKPPGVAELTVDITRDGGSVTREYSPARAAAEMIASARDATIGLRDGRLFAGVSAPSLISTRPADNSDEEFLYQVYRESRRSEVEQFGWQEPEIEAFLRGQFNVRDQAYRAQFPNAGTIVILHDGLSAGSMITEVSDDHLVLVDIAVLPAFRNKGVASRVIEQLQEKASASGLPVRLHVDKSNLSAANVYHKLGFTASSESELHYEMEWKPLNWKKRN